ncbi:hypothetical protein Vadar_019245 [Vaccinium darrowii]|uniref:Uncharacterized protein n=1 Tax=Vaccinium darrowii TaxID=229202 RepID=A0ACB7XIH3_9ERIC|nr:hypothetical protein Vadar_019245 [Vaccinium darrowii]
MMGVQSLVTGLPLKGLGSSNRAGNVNTSGSVETSLRKPPMLLPWPRTQDRKTLPSFVRLNVSLKSGCYQRHQCGGDARDMVLLHGDTWGGDSPVLRRLRGRTCGGDSPVVRRLPGVSTPKNVLGDPYMPDPSTTWPLPCGTPPRNSPGDPYMPDPSTTWPLPRGTPPSYNPCITRLINIPDGCDMHFPRRDFLGQSEIEMLVPWVKGSLVHLVFHRDGHILTELTGTIICSDGVIATSASFLGFLESRKHEVQVDVKILDTQKTYEGVLLEADFCSNRAFVKITSSEPLPHATFGKSDHLLASDRVLAPSYMKEFGRLDRLTDDRVLAASLMDDLGDESQFRDSDVGLDLPKPTFVEGFVSFVPNEEENSEIHNARTSGEIIKACVRNRHDTTIGGCLVDPKQGVGGIIHHANAYDSQIEATPIELLVKYLEQFFKKRGVK